MRKNHLMTASPERAVPGPAEAADPGARELPRHGGRPAGKPGLRELKKARTRAAIREHALRLFREQGYDATTVEQIAEAAEVSPSTFFRYFPTKEDVVLQDDMELLWMDALRAQPPGLPPIPALRAALHEGFARLSAEDVAKLRETTDFTLSVPAVRARMLDELARTIQVMAAAVAERAQRDPDDPRVRTLVGAVLGVAMNSWFVASDDLVRFMEEFERGLALLEAGLPLD